MNDWIAPYLFRILVVAIIFSPTVFLLILLNLFQVYSISVMHTLWREENIILTDLQEILMPFFAYTGIQQFKS